ncbi:Chitin synthase, class 7, partial [Massospora cicadina]
VYVGIWDHTGCFEFVPGQAILHFLSTRICEFMGHYVDGMFFAVVCTLLSVMMVYKYWDSITMEDLEFSVSGNQNVWEVKELMGDTDDHPDTLNSLGNQRPTSGLDDVLSPVRSPGPNTSGIFSMLPSSRSTPGLPSPLNQYHAAPTALLGEKAPSPPL